VALWHGTRDALSPGISIEVMGDEWQPLAAHGERLLAALAGDDDVHPTTCVLHGMVSVEGRVVKSSVTLPTLIDQLLDGAAADPAIEQAAGQDPELAADLAATAALGLCLGAPPSKRVSVADGDLLDPTHNPGWALALAASKAWDPVYDGEPEPLWEDRDYRFLVSQSQVHRQLVRRVCEELNPVHLARFHLSRWFLAADVSPSLARVMRTVSAAGLQSLGLPRLDLRHPRDRLAVAAGGSA
jgi:hypothetical protein